MIFRLFSGALIVYMSYQFLQDEKNVKDVEDLYNTGLDDLFNYGLEFVAGGNALGDSSVKKNETEGEGGEEKKK